MMGSRQPAAHCWGVNLMKGPKSMKRSPLNVLLKVPQSSRGNLAEDKAFAGPDALFRNLGQTLVEPDGDVGADGFGDELMECLVLERAAEGIAALAVEIRGQQMALGVKRTPVPDMARPTRWRYFCLL